MRFPSRVLLLASLATTTPAFGYDLNDQVSLSGILAATGQCQDVSARLPAEDYAQVIADSDSPTFDTTLDRFDNTCRGAMPVQVELDYRPTERDEIFIKVGAAVDNALNPVTPFRLAPWAADLEDDMQYMSDALVQTDPEQRDPEGWIVSLRATAAF